MSWTRHRNSPDSRPLGGGRWTTVFAALGLAWLVGCQSWGPSATVLRPHGPILTRTDALRQQHLERSHYHRDIPRFERYLDGGPDGHQQLPSRFHPVPTRNVFQPPVEPESLWPVAPVERPTGPLPPGSGSSREELPPPRGGNLEDWLEQESSGEQGLGEEWWDGTEAGSHRNGPTHRELVRYPQTRQLDRPVSDWVRGNYGVDVKQAPRLHSALQPSGGIERGYR
jgi:hypothetical protein